MVEFSFLVLIPYSVTGGDDTCELSLSEHQRETAPALGSGSVAGEQGGVSWDASLEALGSGGPLPSPLSWTVVSIGRWPGTGVQEMV